MSLRPLEQADACWLRLQEYFERRPALAAALAEKLGWKPGHARQALAEYQRFCWLAATCGHPVSPSEPVDQVWHLHLQYTRDYWETFCPQVLGCSLHHEPGERGVAAHQRYRDQYAETLASYQRAFGAPPVGFWPAPGTGPRYRLVELRPQPGGRRARLAWSVAALLTLFSAPVLAALGPLDWDGPSFLGLYLALIPLALIASLLLRRSLRTTAARLPMDAPTALEYAYLAGGETRFMDAAVAELMSRGVVRWEDRRLQLAGDPAGLPPQLRAVFNSIRLEPRPERLRRKLKTALRPVREVLERRGLVLDAAAAWRAQLLSAAVPGALLLFGLAKIAVGVARDRPVGFLVVLCLLVALHALVLLLKRPRCSRLADQLLQRARLDHAAALRVPRAADLGLAVALVGTSAMAGTAYAGYHQARAPQSGDGGSSSGDGGGGGGGDGGGGCGGCGGGS